VDGGDHGLAAGVRALHERGETQGDVEAQAVAAIAAFLREHVAGLDHPERVAGSRRPSPLVAGRRVDGGARRGGRARGTALS
jgi:hypothetical protein